METKDIIIVILLAFAIVQEFRTRFKKFLVEVHERREKELIEDKVFWENMYNAEKEKNENKN